MSNYNLQTQSNQNLTFVDPANYKNILRVNRRFSVSRYKAEKIDQLRVEIVASDEFVVAENKNCTNSCGTSRAESANLNFVIALGQKPEYYESKKRQLNQLKAELDAHIAAFAVLQSGGMVRTTDSKIAVVA